MAHVKFRRWGPYVWWICPSRKCNFENKTDLVFVQGAFETKCQYCNTPVTIKMSGGQLSLESTVSEEEEPKTTTAPTPSAKPTAASPPTPVPQVTTQTPSTQIPPPAPPSGAAKPTPPATPPAEATAQKQESASKPKETRKKPAS